MYLGALYFRKFCDQVSKHEKGREYRPSALLMLDMVYISNCMFRGPQVWNLKDAKCIWSQKLQNKRAHVNEYAANPNTNPMCMHSYRKCTLKGLWCVTECHNMCEQSRVQGSHWKTFCSSWLALTEHHLWAFRRPLISTSTHRRLSATTRRHRRVTWGCGCLAALRIRSSCNCWWKKPYLVLRDLGSAEWCVHFPSNWTQSMASHVVVISLTIC